LVSAQFNVVTILPIITKCRRSNGLISPTKAESSALPFERQQIWLDKPADNLLRLTLLHTAKARAYPYQSSNDLGHHHFTYSIAGHRGDWRLYYETRIASHLSKKAPRTT